MTRDYRRGSPPPPPIPKPPRRHRSCVWWFLLGNLVGGAGVATLWMVDPGMLQPVEIAPPDPGRPAPVQPSFEFPKILRDTEVEIGPGGADATSRPAPAAGSKGYMVQAGSFRRAAEAERLKAQLALLGVQTSIQVSSGDGETHHRVRAGPYPDRKTAEQVQTLLKRNNQDSLLVPLP